ncbi:hypothetical protein JCM1841_000046 [Sporobolomyces salmonicolor]
MDRPTEPFDLAGLGADWAIKEGSDGKEFAVFQPAIEQSLNDDRDYRLITLRNGLTALLVSDPETDKAAASLSVQIGHLSDPDDLPGLAHFCEHMLFLGTEKFPDEAEYKTYLSRNSGSSNAYTSMDETNYHFDAAPGALPGALARHAQFFTAPLFDPSCTERELNAVDSEFRRNLQLDARRLFQLGKATSSREPGSVYYKFGTGSKESLWEEPKKRGENVRDRLLEWYGQHYSANLMKLAVLSSQSLDELADIVISEYSNIPNVNREAPIFPVSPISPAVAQTEISYRTVKNTPQLRIEFALPDLRASWPTKPGRYLSHFAGHEGPGSILADLKERGWATSLSSSSSNGAPGFEFFRININMTATGLAHYKEILSIVFSYLSLLKSTPPLEWAWEEMQQLGKIGWRWKEKGQPHGTVRNLASQLSTSLYPPERSLVGPWFATKWDARLLSDILDAIEPELCRVFVGSQDPLPGRKFWKSKEQHYGTEYDVYPLDLEHISQPVSPPANLALPEQNIFVPSRLELVTKEPSPKPFMRPSLVRQTPTTRLFYKKDDIWCIPRASAYFIFRTPLADQTPRHAILTQLFTSLIEESLAKYAYDATLAGLDYAVGTETDGFSLTVSGYTDKLSVLIGVVLDKIKCFQADSKQFELVHDRLERAYRNAKLNNPSTTADSHLRHLTRQTHWTFDDRLEGLQGLSTTDVDQHAAKLIAQLQIDALVHGNLAREDALDMLALVEGKLAARPLAPAENDYHRALVLPKGSNIVYRPIVPSAENVNSAASVYYQVGATTDHALVARLALFAQIAKVPVFSTLRTKEQLGYIVSSSPWTLNAWAGFRVIVQSERPAEYLEDRIEALWSAFCETLERMGEDEFGKERESLAAKKEERAKSLAQESARFWAQIETNELDFASREREAATIRQLTKKDIIDFFQTYISPSSSSRTKLSILMRSQRLQPATTGPLLAAIRASASSAVADAAAALFTSKPTLAQVDEFIQSKIPSLSSEIEVETEKLHKLPVLKDAVRELEEQEVEPFRRGLALAEGYKPVTDFSEDLEMQAHL